MSRWVSLQAAMGETSIHEAWRYTTCHPQVRRAFGVFLACGVVTLVAFLSGLPALRESRAIESALAARYDEAARERGHAALVRAVRQATLDVEAIEKKLATRAVQTALVNQLNAIARRHGVRVVNSSYEESKGGDGNRMLLHELTAEGEYAALRKFVTDLRTLSTFTVIREASFTAPGGHASLLTARFRLATYRGANDGR